jgi:hypothetical protein
VLLRFQATHSIAELAQELKGSSSHLATHKICPEDFFKWQGGYGAFTVSKHEIGKIQAYIRNQEKHHREGTIVEELERTEEESGRRLSPRRRTL